MTASSVTQVNMYSVGATSGSSGKNQSVDDFSQILANQSNSAKESNKDLEAVKTEKKPVDETTKTQKPTELKNEKETSTDEMKETETEDVSVKEVSQENEVVKENGDLSEEETKAALEAIATMVNEISQLLNVTPQDVQNALNELGLNAEDVLNMEALPKLVIALTDGADELSLMTNEDVFANVQKLTELASDILKDLSEEFNIPMEEVNAFLEAATEIPTEFEMPVEVQADTDDTLVNVEDEFLEQQVMNKTVEEKETVKETSENRGKENQTSDNGQNNLNFTQTVLENIRTAVAKTENVETGFGAAQTEAIMNQIEDMIKVIQTEDLTEMELQLHPASLGSVRVQLTSKEGLITASFTAENEAIKAVLESQLVVLKQNFEEQGLKVEAVEVTVASHAFEENLSNSQNSSKEQTEGKRKGTRKLSLNEIMNSDMMDELPEEERVVADMMMRNGNTVDYLA